MANSNSTRLASAASPPPDSLGEAEDHSLAIALHLDNARAVADLLGTVCGSRLDESDNRIDELAPATLRAAMFCIQQEIDAAEELISRHAASKGRGTPEGGGR